MRGGFFLRVTRVGVEDGRAGVGAAVGGGAADYLCAAVGVHLCDDGPGGAFVSLFLFSPSPFSLALSCVHDLCALDRLHDL